jgi:hypothetical protein
MSMVAYARDRGLWARVRGIREGEQSWKVERRGGKRDTGKRAAGKGEMTEARREVAGQGEKAKWGQGERRARTRRRDKGRKREGPCESMNRT